MNDLLNAIPLWYSGPATVAAAGCLVAVGFQSLCVAVDCDVYGWSSDKARRSARGVFKIAAASPFVVALWPLIPVVVVGFLARMACPGLTVPGVARRESRKSLERRVATLEVELRDYMEIVAAYRERDLHTRAHRMPVIQDTITRKDHQ